MAKSTEPKLTNPVGEQIVLGKLLQSAEAYWRVADVLQPMHFSQEIHQLIYAAIRDLLSSGGRHSLGLIEARVGPEYGEDGKSTATLLSALLRQAEEDTEAGALEVVEDIVDLWRRRAFIQMMERGLKDGRNPSKSSYDLLSEFEAQAADINLNSQSVPIKWLGDVAAQVMTESAETQTTGHLLGFDTGLPSLDEIIGRIHGGDMIVIGARPGDGKTVLGAQIAEHGSTVLPALFHQLEMKDKDMARRYLAGHSTASVGDIEAGSYDAFQYQELQAALAILKGSRVAIDDRAKLRVEQIFERALMMKRRFGLGMLVIDHFRHIRTFAKLRDQFERNAHISGDIKAMAKELDIAVFVLSQVTRASQRRDDPKPQLNDLDGGGVLDQDADAVITLFRRDRWLKTTRPADRESPEFRKWSDEWVKVKGLIEITSVKGRRLEDGEYRTFKFDGRASRIREVDR